MTNFLPQNCGNYLLSPVTTSINGYTPVSIVTDGSLTSTPGNPDSITLTNPMRSGTYNVLLQVKNPSGYYIPTSDGSKQFISKSDFHNPNNPKYLGGIERKRDARDPEP